MKVREPLLVAAFSLLSACAPPATRGGFDSPNPASRAYAIEQAVRDHDRAAVPDLVEQLDHDDPLIRFLAISALQRLTGRTLGYVHYAPRSERREAIGRWVQFVLDDQTRAADEDRETGAYGG